MYHSDSSQNPQFSGNRNLFKRFLSIKHLKSFPNKVLWVSLHGILHFFLDINFVVGGQLGELLNFEVSENKADGGAGDYTHWRTVFPEGSFVLESTSLEVEDLVEGRSKANKSYILNCFCFQVALSDSSKKLCSSLFDLSNASTSALGSSYLCLLFMNIPENVFVGRNVCQKNKFHRWKFNSRKSTGPRF